jgi:hypothetical protein
MTGDRLTVTERRIRILDSFPRVALRGKIATVQNAWNERGSLVALVSDADQYSRFVVHPGEYEDVSA